LSDRIAFGVWLAAMFDCIHWEYGYVLPFSVVVAALANASGFSGAVLFQPFFNLVLRLPMAQSIATGVATETIGMSSGASRYLVMKQIDLGAVRLLLPAVLGGVAAGLLVLTRAPSDALRLIVGLVVGAVAVSQLNLAVRRVFGTRPAADLAVLRRFRWRAFLSGSFSACTGTGVAEMNQPLLEHRGGLATKRANATAVCVEALADWAITLVNLSLGNLRLDVLMFSAVGVAVGAQLGALAAPHLPARLLKTIFSLCVLGIAVFYVVTALVPLGSR
jgi:uncharacterized membrane protein YfcA